MADEPDTHQPELDAARTAYAAALTRFQEVVGWFYADGEPAAAQLLELGEEFGADHTVHIMLGDAEQFGPLATHATDSYVADMSDTLEGALENVLVAQDRLDEATARRETGLRLSNPTRPQQINIGGREFVIDTQRGELRSVDVPTERYLLADAADRASHVPAERTLTEQIGQDKQVPLSQPTKDRTPPRSR